MVGTSLLLLNSALVLNLKGARSWRTELRQAMARPIDIECMHLLRQSRIQLWILENR